jgi:hypothetical protein
LLYVIRERKSFTIKFKLTKARHALDQIGMAWNGTVHRDKTMETNGRLRITSAQPSTDPFGRYWNSSGILDTAKHSEGPKHMESQYMLPSKGFYVFFCCNWFLMPTGSEAVCRRSPDSSRADPIRSSAPSSFKKQAKSPEIEHEA